MGKNEVTTVEENSLALVDTPLVSVAQEDMMIPFLKVVQSLSEEVVPGKDKYNENVRPGDLYDSVTRTIFKTAKVVICGLKKYYVEWTPEVRGTLVAKHKPTDDVIKNAVRIEKKTDKGASYTTLQTKDGNELIETYGVVMIVKNDDGLAIPAVLTLSKTSFVVGKQLNTALTIHQMGGRVPIYKLSTTSSSNSKGSWFKPVFAFDSFEDNKDIISMAKGMSAIVDHILLNNPTDSASNSDESSSLEDALEDVI